MFKHFAGLRRIHLVGIGGAGMSGIAEVLLEHGLEVTGSDLVQSEVTRYLEGRGAKVREGHAAEHVGEADLVVKSSAVPDDNPELQEARRRRITVIRRAEMLAELMRLKYGIAVAGTHGKTTTTSMIGTLLTESGLDPTVIVGGRLRISGTGARLGRSVFMVAEADEFDRSFLHLSPIIAVITSLELDHHDTYSDLDDLKEAFVRFARGVPFFGRVIVCLDDPNLQSILPRLRERRVLTYGLSPQADIMASQVESKGARSRFLVRNSAHLDLGEVEVPLPGLHNVQNALASVAVGLTLDLDIKAIREGLESFRGVHRRFERLGAFQGAEVVDDYAHHPSEVAATLAAARQAFGSGGVFAVFQPHLYSRTQHLAEEFGRSLLLADRALVTDIYGSREAAIPGVTGATVVEAARRAGHRKAEFCPHWPDIISRLRDEIRPGDVVLTLGAGDIFRLAHELVGKGDE